ncbi:unnamed protein product [Caenorhabditis auriculariae]|uniref:DOMON domain-containing protein n=1 Tax=Caenorhabditis auriculariae TaxID=2777116 RepID=A0A8S1GN51_9PELO|nr:unnamed protein product [Caenorhabditis auriculariae]
MPRVWAVVVALLLGFGALAQAQQCSFRSGDLSARWQVVDGDLTVEFTNKNIGNNQWTGIGFGSDMSNLEVVVVTIEDNHAKLVTGFTRGYGAPTLDSSSSVAAQSINYNSNTLVVRFSRPIGSVGDRLFSLEDCTTWNFVTDGDFQGGEIGYHNTPPTSVDVCANNSLQNGQIPSIGAATLRLDDVCATSCPRVFDTRDPISNAVPLASIYNNRQSSRFDTLRGGQK